MIKMFLGFINESKKFWYKSNRDFLNWIDLKSNNVFIFIDTETTGLNHPSKEQLTQLSAIASNYRDGKFSIVDSFNVKIKLTDDTKNRMKNPESRIKWVLGFNRYGERGISYHDENKSLIEFKDWMSKFKNHIYVIQNSNFDMKFLNVRSKIGKFDKEVLDTKDIIQLFFIPTLQKLSEKDDQYKKIIDKIGTSSRDNGLISSSMGKIGPILGVDMSGYHDAIFDCHMTIKMMERIISILKENIDIDISKYQSERIKTK